MAGPSRSASEPVPSLPWAESQASEMDAILESLGSPESIRTRFKGEKIYPSTVKLLDDKQLEELGIDVMGDRATLREACSQTVRSKAVRDEVREILSPLPFGPRPLVHAATRTTGGSMIERPKHKGKTKLSQSKYGCSDTTTIGRKPAAKFQKKLVVVDYMGCDAPRNFTIKEHLVLMRGMLPEISVTASDREVHTQIRDTIKSSDESLGGFLLSDFEYLEASGKSLCVPAQQLKFEWTGKAVKELAGSGCVYVRLTTDKDELGAMGDDSSSDELKEHDVKIVRIDEARNASTTIANHPVTVTSTTGSQSSPAVVISTVATTNVPVTSVSQTGVAVTVSTTAVASPPVSSVPGDIPRCYNGSTSGSVYVTSGFSAHEQLDTLAELFPAVPLVQLKFLMEVGKGEADAISDLYLEGLSLSSLLAFLRLSLLDSGDVRRLRIESYADDGDLESLAEDAIAFYKGGRFSPRAEVRVTICDQPAVDTGGVRRQFFSDVFSYLAASESLRLFEGPKNHLRPVFRQSSISSGMLTLVGKMVGHSILMDDQGFPFPSPACYYYMAGHMDRAISVTSMADASERVKHAVSQLSNATTSEELLNVDCCDVVELMDQSGCDLPLKVENIPGICDSIIIYDVLHKRKFFLDAFADGLEVFHMKSAIHAFPELFMELFVASGACSPSDVLSILQFDQDLSPEEQRVARYLKNAIQNLSETELKDLLRCATGSPYHRGNKLYVQFHSQVDLPAFSFGTCGNQMSISALIRDEESFMLGLTSTMPGRQFTMP